MNQVKMIKPRVLAMAILSCASATSTYVFAQDTEVESLRKEIKELRSLIEQNKQDSSDFQTQIQQLPAPTKVSDSKVDFKNIQTKSGAQFELYGILRADGIYQVKGAQADYNNIHRVPLEGTADERKYSDTFKSTVNVTRLGLNFSHPNLNHNVGGKLEMDFFGSATRDQFRIRHAYLTYDQWLIGQTWSTFITPEYTPESIDAGTFVGASLQRSPLVRYSDKISDSTHFTVSVEDPKYTTATDPEGKTKFPVLAGKLSHTMKNAEFAGRSFLTQKETNHDELFSWGVGLGGKYQLNPNLHLKADYYHVKGDGKLVNWTNASYVIDTNGQMHANEFDSITAGLGIKLSPQLRSNIGFGYMQANDDNQFARQQINSTDQNKSLWQGWVNALYSPTKPITFGAELVYGERETFNDLKGKDQRLNLMAAYEF